MAFRISTESLARASAARPWTVIGVWLVLLVAALGLIGAFLGGALTTEVHFTNNPESKRADTLLEDRLRGPEKTNEVVIVRSPDKTVDDPAYRQFVEGLYGRITSLGPGIIESGTDFYQSNNPTLVSQDSHTTILPFVMAGKHEDANDHIGRMLAVTDSADGRDGFQVLQSGGASVDHASEEVSQHDLERGESIGVPIALVVLLIVFGAVVAALIPVILGIFAIVIAVGLIALLGQEWQFSFFVTNVVTMMGLAVGIDYSLFIVSRYREERASGLEKREAIAAAGATASRAVLFSGLTVVFALAGMLIVPSTIWKSLAGGATIVVLISVAISLTLLPAILSLLGDRVNSLRIPFVGRVASGPASQSIGNSHGFWDRVTRTVMRYPVISLLAASALLIALAIPYVDMKTGSAGISTLPDNIRAKQGFEILQRDFSFGLVTPAEIAIHGDIHSPQVQGAVLRLTDRLAQDPIFGKPAPLQVNQTHDVALISVSVNGDPTSDATINAVKRLRGEYVPQAFSGADAEAPVTGATAHAIDYFNQTSDYTPIVIAFVLGLSFILLTVVFRSLIVPVKAIIMNLLSVGAAYGLLVLFFQKGVGHTITGFQQVDIIEAWVPLWTFGILFGLSMDYHVFLLSRIRERFLETGDNSESVAFGVRSTAAIITGAALIMASVFGGVALGDMVMFQQMGFGLGVAVILDATIVRSVLVPAAMQLLGPANWYLPKLLNWLPEMRMEPRGRRDAGQGRAAGGVEAS